MSKYKLTFKLKQHTPIIHFQHDQHGATLRASELKPKLDKFLIEKLREKGQIIPNDWKVGKKNRADGGFALNYKVKVTTGEERKNYKMRISQNRRGKWQTSFPTFFANMGKDTEEELINFTLYDDLEIIIICFINDLKGIINENFAEFIATTNFGTRQSKGFGSYSIDEKIDIDYPYLKIDKSTSMKNIFEVINYYHQRLKSGVNYSNSNNNFCHYEEAFVKKYLRNINANYIWDKKWLKEKFFPLQNDGKEKRFVRALLGLSYDFDFKILDNDCNPGGTLPEERIKVSLEIDVDDEIHRIKSPILYKPIKTDDEWRIYIIIDDNHIQQMKSVIGGNKFKFTDGRRIEELKTPDNVLNFKELIRQYNNELTSRYTSYSYRGKCCDVEINNN